MAARRATAFPRSALLLLCALIACRKPAPDAKLRAEYAALPYRPVALRLTTFPHRSLAKVTRGTDELDVSITQLQIVAAEVKASTTADPRVRAAARTFLRDHRGAISLLEATLRKDQRDAHAWSDLAVHCFELARRGNEPGALADALVATDRAIAVDPSLPEPHFNRAAILDAMGLGKLAAKAWGDAAAKERDPAWAEEARARVKTSPVSRNDEWKTVWPEMQEAALAADVSRVDALLARFAQEARTNTEGPVLALWGAAQLARDRENAAKQLQIAHVVGSRLRDPLLGKAVAAIRDAERRGTTDTLARAHVQYKRARILIHERRPGDAEATMAEAERLFRVEKSPVALVARAYRAGIAFDRNQLDDATMFLDDLERETPPEMLAMRAHVQWDRARLASRRGDVYAQLRHSNLAGALYEQLHEHDFAVRMRSFVATILINLGRSDEAWRVRLTTFAEASKSGNPDLLEHVLHATAREQIVEKRFDVASSLFGLMLSEPVSSPVRRFEALLWQALVASTTNGSFDVTTLATAAAAIRDDELRATAHADAWLAEALLVSDERPRDAVDLLTKSIEARETRGLGEALPDAYVARGQAQARLGADDDAARDFASALSAIEERSARVAPLLWRDTFFASAETACRELLALDARHARFEAVFETAERCRARVLADAVARKWQRAPHITLEEAQRRVSHDSALVHYTVLEDRLLIVVVESSRFHTRVVQTSRADMQSDAVALASAMEEGDHAATDRLLRKLHALLIAPIAHELGTRRLVISPDETLAGVPFAALRETSGRYLIEHAPITMAASAATYFAGTARPIGKNPRVAVVGDPAFDGSVVSVPRLPAAEAEARDVAALYEGALLLTGTDATSDRVRRELPSADLVHIAAHVIVSSRDAAASTLVLAPSLADNGLVYQAVLATLELPRAPFVVLAGCRTASAAGGRGSIRSIALAFLAAGSRGVIGSLWNVDDAATRAVSYGLHRRLVTMPAADALRDAQLALLRGHDTNLRSPAVWAAFQIHGFAEGEGER